MRICVFALLVSVAATAVELVRPPNPVISQNTSYIGGSTKKPNANMPTAKIRSLVVSARFEIFGWWSFIVTRRAAHPSG